MRVLPKNPWLALPIAWLVFIGVGLVARGLVRLAPSAPVWGSQALLKLLVVGVALGAASIELPSLRALGFTRPEAPVWGRAIGGGLALGAVATLVAVFAGATGMRSIVEKYSFGAMVLWIWIVSSASEEIFCRGWFQASTGAPGKDARVAALLPSAVLFGALHLALLSAGIDVRSVLCVVAAASVLGLLAAWARARSASLYPAIAAHVAFNVGGVAGGAAYAIGFYLVTGHAPFGAS